MIKILINSLNTKYYRLALLMMLNLLFGFNCFASHYEVITPDDNTPIQCLVQDLRHPFITIGQYIACYSQRFRTREGWNGYFYGGYVADSAKRRSLLQFGSWQMSGKGVPPADISFVYAGKNMSWQRSTWEGSAGGIKGHFSLSELPPNKWRRFRWRRGRG